MGLSLSPAALVVTIMGVLSALIFVVSCGLLAGYVVWTVEMMCEEEMRVRAASRSARVILDRLASLLPPQEESPI